MKSIKSECLDHLILSSVEQLEYILRQCGDNYPHERIHQSLGRIIEPKHMLDPTAEVVCLECLGGLLKAPIPLVPRPSPQFPDSPPLYRLFSGP